MIMVSLLVVFTGFGSNSIGIYSVNGEDLDTGRLDTESVVGKRFSSKRADSFKVIGYYCGDWFDVPVEKLQVEKLTHVIYGFIFPLETGECSRFEKHDDLVMLINKCHKTGVQIYVSIGGYADKSGKALEATFEKIAASDLLRAKFVGNIMDIVNSYGFDGVELDWEYPKPSTSGDYEHLISDLSAKLSPLGKGLSSALPGTGSTDGQNVWTALEAVSENTLSYFDFINLMCYDLHSDPDHSPIWFSNTSIAYWKNFRDVPAEKLVLGMPLYARPSWDQYRFLVEQDKENAYKDHIIAESVRSSYNGLNTLREKTMMAFRKAGGVMLFDVNEDTYDETSAVSMIHDTLKVLDGLSDLEIDDYVWIVINNQPIYFNKNDGMGFPFIDENSRTLVPARKILETVGAVVDYASDDKGLVTSVSAVLNETKLTIYIGDNKYLVNGEVMAMNTVAIIKDGRTYLPVRTMLEAFGFEVTYSEAGKCVYSTNN
jgi:chitinase